MENKKEIKANEKEVRVLGRKVAKELTKEETNVVAAGTADTPDRVSPLYERKQ
ncbi:hypothetical protein [Thalassotalea montiporae]